VYIYDMTSANPLVPVSKVENPGVTNYPLQFGVALSMDGSRLLVGAPGNFVADTPPGQAYLYDLDSADPLVPIRKLANPPNVQNSYAVDVSISGRYCAIIAPYDGLYGRAYVFDLVSQGIYTLQNFSNVQVGFLKSVAVSGNHVILGGYDESNLYSRGFLYDLAGLTPTVPVALLQNPIRSNDEFGISVALDGPTLVVGAPHDHSIAVNRGAAFVYSTAGSDTDNDGLLDVWEHAKFGTIAGHGPQDDTDGDGRVELLEMAFDCDPLSPDSTTSKNPVLEGGYLTLTIQKRAGVQYSVQSSASPEASGYSSADTSILINNASTLKVRDNFPISTSPSRFMRVLVNAAP
jgi:hypothetical protein